MSDREIGTGDIVEHKLTGQTWRVLSIADGIARVKGNGQSAVFPLNALTKAPDRPKREASKIAAK